ncbi:MAG: polyphosphate kinase 1 [Saprospiraceae bacterium]|nr:polyphosphate kinase 1 [Saprospiraceae bacterium]
MTEDVKVPYIHRDISWLSFNYRVLQEAKDPTVPLFERLKFLAIYSNNLDEFFRVRVASLRNLVRVGKKTKRKLDYSPKLVLRRILEIVDRQQEEFSYIFENEIIPELRDHHIYLIRRLEMNEEQRSYVEDYFNEKLLPFVQPVLLKEDKVRPFLNNAQLYLTIVMTDPDKSDKKKQYAILKIPSDHLPRFIKLPSRGKRNDVIMLDDIVRHSVDKMFPGYEILDTYSIKLTRDAELYIDDEFSGDLIGKIKNSLEKRHVGPASRFVYDREIPEELLSLLVRIFNLERNDLLKEGRYHNNFDFFKFPTFGMDNLKNPELPPLSYKPLEEGSFFTEIQKKDHLIHVPYHSYESVIRFFEQAAVDPKVTHIKIVQYRVARQSRIMEALKTAIKAGKQVFAFIEVKARFDEEANLIWGEELEKIGVVVRYSFPGVKVHSKLALVRRLERGKEHLYCYLSTGNFHEDTAKVYSDFGLFTANKQITGEVARVFSFLETVKVPTIPFEHLLVGQFNLRSRLMACVDNEIKNAKNGEKARIILKMNSIQDISMVEKLYQASQAGVEIKLLVRGICSIIPGLPGISENIEALSIVDRYLEHARIFVFYNGGAENYYLSSADWMVRNLSYRVETAFPILDKDLQKIIKDFLEIQLSDNVKSRIIDGAQSNAYKKDGSNLAIRSQTETYFYLKRIEESRTV